ncbi:MAG: anti-sigma F factor [Clostridia bacterium]|jgi:stage II sporulation protein AB (anti-sigma F factor)|nr:anti-sigma F factor [Clostridia bacterium]
MTKHNCIKTSFSAIPENESLARVICASFISVLDPTIEQLTDVKTAVSEAVTNSIVHGYSGSSDGTVYMDCTIDGETLTVEVRDSGKGIEDITKAMEPMYTSCPEAERSGMGFTVMETFMDSVTVSSVLGVGTKVTMKKIIRSKLL